MTEVRINLDSVNKVKEFSNIVSGLNAQIDITSNDRRYVIDAKSIMGIFSLNLEKDLNLIIRSEDDTTINAVKTAVEKFIVA